MVKDTQRRIEEYKAMLPGVKERIAAVALMLVMSMVMMASASYAWVTISRAPEVKGMSTTISGNGNLEIALVSPEGVKPNESTSGDSSATPGQTLLGSNITWGNLVNLSDSGYGLDQIALRPALLSGYNRNTTPLFGASYGEDGRVTSTSQTYSYATWKQAEDGNWFFDAANPTYGVRAIASVTYENITGNATANKMMQRARDAYATARAMYGSFVTNETLISSEGVYPQVYSMDALTSVLQIFVQDKASYYASKLGSGTYATADYSGVVTYMYRFAMEFQKILDKEGEALLYLANLQAYLNGAESTETFANVTELLNAYKAGTLASKGVQLDSLSTYSQDCTDIAKAIKGLKPYAEACDPDTVTNPEKLEWSSISTYVNYMVDINSTTIAKDRSSQTFAIGGISSDNLMDLLGILQNCQSDKTPADVVISKGIIYRLEQRLPSVSTDTLEGRNTMVIIRLTVKVLIVNMNNTPVYAQVRTTAAEPYTSNLDEGRTASMENSGNKGDAVANDTYGMAIDLWVRTNVSNVVLTLEGSLVTKEERAYGVDKNGNSIALHLLKYEGDSMDAYQLDGYWYDADTHTELFATNELPSGYVVADKMVEKVVGYDGVNRVWEDYLGLIEAGLMAENNTTQGAGSCYVFYADPSDQTRILHLLEAFTVVFVDQEGNTLGTAKLDTEHYFSINGKTTVPLKLITSQTSYVDENGEHQLGITSLNKNEATWITALIYLDGQRLSNADVLAVGEIEGSLNIQFGSSVSLENLDDDKLRNEYREITASLTADGATSASSASPISFEYDGKTRQAVVTLLVTGEQPKSIKAFFVRSISQSQGTRGDTIEFKSNGDNTWSATFDLSKPGKYSLRNLIVDGADYALDDGTVSGMDNFPTIIIEGLGISSIYCDLPNGVTMTADSSVSAFVSASINASAELMPKQVRALFRSTSGREFAALLAYDAVQGNWSGTTRITESGTYTLQYLVIDGQYTEIDEEMQTHHVVYLGLTTQIWSTGVQLDDGSFSHTFEYKGAVNLAMQLKLFDGAGNELKRMEDVWLYYHSEGSTLDQDGMYGQVTWNANTGFYEGTLELKSGGTFVFDRVVTERSSANPSTVRRASLSPIFLAYVTDPPEYTGHNTLEYQFVPNGGATMNVSLTNAQTSTMWAEIKNLTSGVVYMVPCTSRTALDVDQNLYRFVFDWTAQLGDISAQDGNWQLMALYMQGVARPNENPNEDPIWTPVTGDEPTAENSYMVDLSGQSITTYVVQTVNITITDSTGNKYTGEVFGKDANGNIIGTFMQGYNSKDIVFTIKDWNGQPIQGLTSITWESKWGDNSLTYGGYTGAYQQPPAVTLTGSGTTFALSAQTFRMAGSYSSGFTVNIGGTTMTVAGPSFQVWSITPTVAITGGKSGSTTSSTNASFTANSITVNFVTSSNTTCGVTTTNYTSPYVNIQLAGIGYASNATLEFSAGGGTVHLYSTGGGSTSNSNQSQFTWTADGTCTRYVGAYTYKSAGSDSKTAAGTLTATQIVLTYDGHSYIVTLPATITISNPN